MRVSPFRVGHGSILLPPALNVRGNSGSWPSRRLISHGQKPSFWPLAVESERFELSWCPRNSTPGLSLHAFL